MSQSKPVLDAAGIQKFQQVIERIVKQYTGDPDSALSEFRSNTRSISGFESEANSGEFSQTLDEPEELGGTNKGANPVEVLLGALGTCQEIVLVAYAAALGIELDSVKIDVRGSIDLRGLFNVADVPAGFQKIRFDAQIESPNATVEQLEELKALGLAHCPVLDTLQRSIPVETTYRLSAKQTAA